jgi:hypothetical protein
LQKYEHLASRMEYLTFSPRNSPVDSLTLIVPVVQVVFK